jgi:DNA-binding NtrC family response regulator
MRQEDLTARAIAFLARRCAFSNLTLADARDLFDALYLADALRSAEGNRTMAAEIAGISRGHFHKRRRVKAIQGEPSCSDTPSPSSS